MKWREHFKTEHERDESPFNWFNYNPNIGDIEEELQGLLQEYDMLLAEIERLKAVIEVLKLQDDK
jgi:hypothetical protein